MPSLLARRCKPAGNMKGGLRAGNRGAYVAGQMRLSCSRSTKPVCRCAGARPGVSLLSGFREHQLVFGSSSGHSNEALATLPHPLTRRLLGVRGTACHVLRRLCGRKVTSASNNTGCVTWDVTSASRP